MLHLLALYVSLAASLDERPCAAMRGHARIKRRQRTAYTLNLNGCARLPEEALNGVGARGRRAPRQPARRA
jgi:hypothetical protein